MANAPNSIEHVLATFAPSICDVSLCVSICDTCISFMMIDVLFQAMQETRQSNAIAMPELGQSKFKARPRARPGPGQSKTTARTEPRQSYAKSGQELG